jgi:NAD+ diphosphatase
MGRSTEGALALHLTGAVDRPDSVDLTFLGVDADDVAYFAEHVAERDLEDPAWSDLRRAGSALDARDAGLMVTAVALDNWLRTHQRCPRCGAETVFNAAGWSRTCPQDGSEHFPRTDPAVIVLVRDRQDRALLGRQGRWAEGWFSTLAGFVESGESAEAAVRREIREESGVVIADGLDDIRYLGSQPWPFPCSLMLGYHAWTDDPAIEVDGDEIAEARWFTREELASACESGDVRLPPPVSIARRLVERWYGAELPGQWSRPLAR